MAQKIKVFTDIRYLKVLQHPRFTKGWTTMARLPWDKTLGHVEALSPAQLEVVSRFTEVAHATAGMPLAQRLQEIRAKLSTGKGSVASAIYGIPAETYLAEMRARKRKPEEVISSELATFRALKEAKLSAGYTPIVAGLRRVPAILR